MRSHLLTIPFVFFALTMALPAFAGDAEQASARYEKAAKLVERGALEEAAVAWSQFARDFPKDPRAPRAFADFAILSMRLGHLNAFGAESNLGDFENTFVPVNIDLWAEMAFTMIDGFTDRNESHDALKLLHRTLTITEEWSTAARRKKSADLQTLEEIEIRARGRLARLCTEIGDHRGADAEYARIRKLASGLHVWPGKKEPKTTAKYAETIAIIAGSFFYAAEQKRFEANRLPLPPYIGKGDRDSVLAFINGPGEQWYKRREFLVKEAHRLYMFVLGAEFPKPDPPKPAPPSNGMITLLGGDPSGTRMPTHLDPMSPYYAALPPPSPHWAIAAAERVGRLWTDFRRERLSMPVPTSWKPSPSSKIPGTDLTYADLKGEYTHSYVDPPAEELKQEAKTAYRYCLDLALKHRIVNEHTDACIKWLSKNYGAEYHEIDDFAPPGELFALGYVSRPAPLPRFTHEMGASRHEHTRGLLFDRIRERTRTDP